jgi:dihydroorotate dehydrogenase electron transfer subunit
MIQQSAKVLWNTALGGNYHKIGLQCRRGMNRLKPGQFVMLRVFDGVDPLLRRPFSVHKLVESDGRVTGIEILYKVVGKGTRLLAGIRAGDSLDVLGPLGSAFLLPENAHRVFIVAGGIGIAPMVFLATHLLEREVLPDNVTVFVGGRTKDDLLCLDDFDRLGIVSRTSTDDGSAGDHCLVTLPVELALDDRQPDVIYACGPLEMLKCVSGIAESRGIACQVSIETRMACGMGACLGCAVPIRNAPATYVHACLDGPVFDLQEIQLFDATS